MLLIDWEKEGIENSKGSVRATMCPQHVHIKFVGFQAKAKKIFQN